MIIFGQFDPVRFIGGVGRLKKMFRNNNVDIIPFEEHFPMIGSAKKVSDSIERWIIDQELYNG